MPHSPSSSHSASHSHLRPHAAAAGSPFKSPLSAPRTGVQEPQDVEELRRQIRVLEEKVGGKEDEIVQQHVRLLNEYNGVKDECTKIFERLAEMEALPSRAIWRRYGLSSAD
ncbi:hypothetical protein ACQY0O_007664 [Thecaphora frezii]